MLRKIKLYGKLAKFIGHRVLEADVATAAEAVRTSITASVLAPTIST
jgi:predicted phage tail protein